MKYKAKDVDDVLSRMRGFKGKFIFLHYATEVGIPGAKEKYASITKSADVPLDPKTAFQKLRAYSLIVVPKAKNAIVKGAVTISNLKQAEKDEAEDDRTSLLETREYPIFTRDREVEEGIEMSANVGAFSMAAHGERLFENQAGKLIEQNRRKAERAPPTTVKKYERRVSEYEKLVEEHGERAEAYEKAHQISRAGRVLIASKKFVSGGSYLHENENGEYFYL